MDTLTMADQQPAERSVYGAVAVRYWGAGWHGVLPLPARAKTSPPTGFTGKEGAWPTTDDLDVWVRAQPDGNVALRMPATVIGLDVDDYGDKPGRASLAELEEKCGPLPATWSSTSRHGAGGQSGIRFFRIPEGVRLQGAPRPGIEIVQYHHRYAVVWPSMHPEGRRYRWLAPDGVVAFDFVIPRPDELPDLPEAWLAELVEKPAGERPKVTERAKTDDWSRAVTDAFAATMRTLNGGGSRHDATLTGLMALARLEEREHPGADDAIESLERAFLGAVTADRGEVEAGKEWRRMIDGARADVAASPASTPTWTVPRSSSGGER